MSILFIYLFIKSFLYFLKDKTILDLYLSIIASTSIIIFALS